MIRHYYKEEIRTYIKRYLIYRLIAAVMLLLLIFG